MRQLATILNDLSNLLYTEDWREVKGDVEHKGHGGLSRLMYHLCQHTFLSRYWLK